MVNNNELLNVLCFGSKSSHKYPPSVRQFCLSLHYYSPRAYKHVRQSFFKRLPHPRTIIQWYSNSDISGDEGIQSKNMDRLGRIVKNSQEKEIFCSLVVDEIDIRQQISWDPHNGYSGIASEINENSDGSEDSESIAESEEVNESIAISRKKKEKSNMAKQAIVFILNGINVNFEFPVAYWLIRNLNRFQRKQLLKQVIIAVTLAGIKIVNVTFDCHPCNVPMCKLFGANLNMLDLRNLTTFIINPVNGEKIFIFLDPCHVEKLIRNTLANKKIIFYEGAKEIKWEYIERLHEFSEKHDFNVHKINKKHIQWKRNSMNVGVANETMSKSVADALEFLMGCGLDDFSGATHTIEFIRMVDRLFNVLNSKTMAKEDIFKRALNANNKMAVFNFLQSCIECIKKLTVVEENTRTKVTSIKSILQSRNKAAFCGIIINIKSLMSIFHEYVDEKQVFLKIPTYCFLQDTLELFFARIRAQSRGNTNPNALQFKGAYRKLLCNIKIEVPEKANCRIFDQVDNMLTSDYYFSNIFLISSRRPTISAEKFENTFEAFEAQKNAILEDVVLISEINESDPLLDACTNYSIIYMAASIEKKIKTSIFQCSECVNVLYENEKIEDINSSVFLHCVPCRSTVDICRHAEKFIKLYDFRKSKVDYDFKVIYCLIFRSLDFSNLYSDSKFECDFNHKYVFVKCVVEQYVAIKAAYISKRITLDQYKIICRQQLTKLILHRGQ